MSETETKPTTRPRLKVAEPPEAELAEAGSTKGQSLQDQFLNYLRKHKTPVTMFLVKGVKLQGIVTWFDNFSILLRRDGQSQLVYKHAVSTIMPSMPIDARSIFEEGIRIPAVKIYNAGVYNEDLVKLVMHQTRKPDWCAADLNALIASCRVAARRIEVCPRCRTEHVEPHDPMLAAERA